MDDFKAYPDSNALISGLERKRQDIRLQRERLESSLQRKKHAHQMARQQIVANCEVLSNVLPTAIVQGWTLSDLYADCLFGPCKNMCLALDCSLMTKTPCSAQTSFDLDENPRSICRKECKAGFRCPGQRSKGILLIRPYIIARLSVISSCLCCSSKMLHMCNTHTCQSYQYVVAHFQCHI
jgi:hypothetical protein